MTTIDQSTKINLFAGIGTIVVVASATFFIAGIAQKVEANSAQIIEFKGEMKILTEIRERLVRIETKIDKDK